MNIEKLQSFLMVAETGSLSAAAEKGFLTISAVSRQISSLEDELGIKLINRTSKGIRLTREGERSLPYVRRIVSEYDNLILNIREKDVLEIVSIPFQRSVLPLIKKFMSAYPKIQIALKEMHGEQILTVMEKGEYELGFAGSIYTAKEFLEQRVLYADRLGIIVNRSHRFADRDCVAVSELKDEEFCMLLPESGVYKVYHGICAQYGFVPKVYSVCSREDTIISMVTAGNIISFGGSSEFISFDNHYIKWIPLEEKYYSGMCLVRNRNKQLSETARIFWDFVSESIGR